METWVSPGYLISTCKATCIYFFRWVDVKSPRPRGISWGIIFIICLAFPFLKNLGEVDEVDWTWRALLLPLPPFTKKKKRRKKKVRFLSHKAWMDEVSSFAYLELDYKRGIEIQEWISKKNQRKDTSWKKDGGWACRQTGQRDARGGGCECMAVVERAIDKRREIQRDEGGEAPARSCYLAQYHESLKGI